MTASVDMIPELLLAWYDRHARALPWRVRGGEGAPDPYRVWLSEIMLQQTTVAAVKPYFAKFVARWPTFADLAAAPEQDVMAAWAGLGYYSRARSLVKCAAVLAEKGSFPETEEELRKLPGLGAYTAAAVAAIAFGKRAVVVDANVERVVSRLFAIEQPLPASRPAIRRHTDSITPDERAGDFAQAMMDLGSGICTSRDPKCLLCPLSARCAARSAGDPARFPLKTPKKPKPQREGTVYWIAAGPVAAAEVWLTRREPGGLLGGMRALPDDGWTAKASGNDQPPLPGEWRDCGVVQHVFTHFSLRLRVLAYAESLPSPTEDGEWWPVDEIEDAGLPTVFAKAARLALA